MGAYYLKKSRVHTSLKFLLSNTSLENENFLQRNQKCTFLCCNEAVSVGKFLHKDCFFFVI